MTSGLKAVKIALLSLVAVHFSEMKEICPHLVASPARRTDATPQSAIDLLSEEAKAIDEGEVKYSVFLPCLLLFLTVLYQENSLLRTVSFGCSSLKVIFYTANCPAVQGADLVFFGDSITEMWRGTDQGR
jgi:hypothetical protein